MLKSKLIAAAALALAMTAPASAQTVLTVSSEQTTTYVRNFNPFNQTSARATTKDFIYEPLAIFNRLAGAKWEYRLAESFELADDLKSISFTLRDGLKWSDGQPLTVDDVVFTYDYLKKFPALDFNSVSALMESVEKVDDRTVRFNLMQPNSLVATTIVGMPIVPEHIWKDVADPVTFANETPVGSGPLTEISRFTPQVYEQCRNPNYWDAASLHVDCMRLPQLADNPQVLAALADGTLDWATSFIPDIDNTFVAKDPEHNKYWFLPSSLVAFTLNLETPDANNKKAFNDVNFRRAVSMLIDRQSIIDIAGYGYPVINEDPAMLGSFYKAFGNPEVVTQFGQYGKFDLDAGKALLEKSGYVDADGDGFRDNPDGTPIAIDIEIPNGWTDWIDAVQIAIETLKAGRAQREDEHARGIGVGLRPDRRQVLDVAQRHRIGGQPLLPLYPLVQSRRFRQEPHLGPALDRSRGGRDAQQVHPGEGPGRAEVDHGRHPAQGGRGHAGHPGLQQPVVLPVQHQALHRLGQCRQPDHFAGCLQCQSRPPDPAAGPAAGRPIALETAGRAGRARPHPSQIGLAAGWPFCSGAWRSTLRPSSPRRRSTSSCRA